jgi:hypothetical protein
MKKNILLVVLVASFGSLELASMVTPAKKTSQFPKLSSSSSINRTFSPDANYSGVVTPRSTQATPSPLMRVVTPTAELYRGVETPNSTKIRLSAVDGDVIHVVLPYAILPQHLTDDLNFGRKQGPIGKFLENLEEARANGDSIKEQAVIRALIRNLIRE